MKTTKQDHAPETPLTSENTPTKETAMNSLSDLRVSEDAMRALDAVAFVQLLDRATTLLHGPGPRKLDDDDHQFVIDLLAESASRVERPR